MGHGRDARYRLRHARPHEPGPSPGSPQRPVPVTGSECWYCNGTAAAEGKY